MSFLNPLQPAWPVPPWVRAFSFLPSEKEGALTQGQQDQINSYLPAAPMSLEQVHGNLCLQAPYPFSSKLPQGDGLVTQSKNCPLLIKTADCLPILLYDSLNKKIGALHGGWQGLAMGIIPSGTQSFSQEHTLVWIGPGIGPNHYEVDKKVEKAFRLNAPEAMEAFSAGTKEGRWQLDLTFAARLILNSLGFHHVFSSHWDTFHHPWLCSYRKNKTSHRIATTIWMEEKV